MNENFGRRLDCLYVESMMPDGTLRIREYHAREEYDQEMGVVEDGSRHGHMFVMRKQRWARPGVQLQEGEVITNAWVGWGGPYP